MENQKIIEIIAEQLGMGTDEITEASSLHDDLSADSLDLFQIIMALEEEYELEIPTEDAEGIQTVADVIKYISERK